VSSRSLPHASSSYFTYYTESQLAKEAVSKVATQQCATILRAVGLKELKQSFIFPVWFVGLVSIWFVGLGNYFVERISAT
jgi:hypothetical protein